MIMHSILTVFLATASICAIAGSAIYKASDVVKQNFEQVIPNLPGKSLVTVEVEYPLAVAHYLTRTLSLPSSTHSICDIGCN